MNLDAGGWFADGFAWSFVDFWSNNQNVQQIFKVIFSGLQWFSVVFNVFLSGFQWLKAALNLLLLASHGSFV